jgi:uncharacterized protein YbcI
VVRLKGVLSTAEQHLVGKLNTGKGKDLAKQVRAHLVDQARPTISAMVEGIAGVKVHCMHHDICTATGEEVVVFSLAEAPLCRELRSGVPATGESSRNSNGQRRREVLA